MMYLSECLKINTSIEELYLCYNNSGVNEKNMIYLSECLEIDRSVKKLSLEGNN